MVVAAVCPVHGPFESRLGSFGSSTNVRFTGNMESCPVAGCEHMAKTMDGAFSFLDNQTIIHEAPDWSIRALSAVTKALGEAIRVAAEPDSTVQDVEVAFDKAALLTKLNVRDAPPRFRDQLLEILSLKSPTKTKGYKKKVLVSCLILHFLLQNYSTYKESAVEITNDIMVPSAELAIDTLQSLTDEARTVIRQMLEQSEDGEQPPEPKAP